MSFLPIQVILWTAGIAMLAAGAGTDLKNRIIPNELVLAVALCGIGLRLASEPRLIWLSLLAAVIVFCAFGILSHYHMIGGGDLKLITAVTLFVPPNRAGELLTGIVLSGGVLSCIYLALRYAFKRGWLSPFGATRPPGRLAQTIKTERTRILTDNTMPYAVAVLAGVCAYGARELLTCFYATSCL
jgi:prepilin peptidase CpaA